MNRKSSNYWALYKYPFCTFHYEWNDRRLDLDQEVLGFYMKFIELTLKFGIIEPATIYLDKNFPPGELAKQLYEKAKNRYIQSVEEAKEANKEITHILRYKLMNQSWNLSSLYNLNNENVFPCRLYHFNQNGKVFLPEVNQSKEMIDGFILSGSNSVFYRAISLLHLGHLSVSINSDLFFDRIPAYNSIIRFSSDDEIKTKGIDNYDLALLNTPRLNSFLRDLRELTTSYGAKFAFESFSEEAKVSSSGILLNNELLYYEDVVDLLKDKYDTEIFL